MGICQEAKCKYCGNDLQTKLFSLQGAKLDDGTYICWDCIKRLGISALTLNKPSSFLIDTVLQSKKMIENNEFQPTSGIYRESSAGTNIQDVVLEYDEKRKLVRFELKNQFPYIRPAKIITDFDYIENGETLISGNSLLGAAIGGELFGIAGAIVGAGYKDKKIKHVCKTISIKIICDDSNIPEYDISILSVEPEGVLKTSQTYITACKLGKKYIQLLNDITQKNRPQKEAVNINNFSVADEIKKFKELLDMGAITKEEYEIKKKQLLKLS